METPAYLFDQYARERGLTAAMAKRALMLKGLADEGRSFEDAVASLRMSKKSAQRVCRKLIIDFYDYRPFAAKEKKGEPRPVPFIRDIARPATELPLFGVVQ